MIQNCSIWNIFAEFAYHPMKTFQIRELSRKISLAHTSVRIHLKELEKQGLIKKEKTGVYYAYKANFEDENFTFYKKILNTIKLKDSGLVSFINNSLTPDAIILFGSYAKGEDIETSE